MEIKSFYSVILLIFCWTAKAQVSLSVKELPVESYRSYVPNNRESLNHEIRYPGHILEITISNESDRSVSLPLDSTTYALPYTDDVRKYYRGEVNMIPDPDLFNVLGVFAFVYQKGEFKISELDNEPFYDELQLQEIQKEKKLRLEEIRQWKENKNINSELSANYNWYLMNHMVTIPAHNHIKYKIYFNPSLKMLSEYSDMEYYYGFDPKISYEIVLKLILTKNLYKFLTKEDIRKYPDLFMGVLSSNRLLFKAVK